MSFLTIGDLRRVEVEVSTGNRINITTNLNINCVGLAVLEVVDLLLEGSVLILELLYAASESIVLSIGVLVGNDDGNDR